MIGMIVVLGSFFFVASFFQFASLQSRIEQSPTEFQPIIVMQKEPTWHEGLSPEFKALAVLEANALERRYHQANVLLMSRVWARYLGFVTGMILALVGAAFILGKLQEEISAIRAQSAIASLNFRSASPGVLLGALGVTLMIVTIITHQEITTADAPVYLRPNEPKPVLNRPAAGSDMGPTSKPYSW
jgi:hypothetical protein